MPAVLFLLALVAGAALLALWLDVRFPGLAPSGLQRRLAAACAAGVLLTVAPAQATVVSLVGVLLPALAFAFLTGLWLLRVLSDG